LAVIQLARQEHAIPIFTAFERKAAENVARRAVWSGQRPAAGRPMLMMDRITDGLLPMVARMARAYSC